MSHQTFLPLLSVQDFLLKSSLIKSISLHAYWFATLITKRRLASTSFCFFSAPTSPFLIFRQLNLFLYRDYRVARHLVEVSPHLVWIPVCNCFSFLYCSHKILFLPKQYTTVFRLCFGLFACSPLEHFASLLPDAISIKRVFPDTIISLYKSTLLDLNMKQFKSSGYNEFSSLFFLTSV